MTKKYSLQLTPEALATPLVQRLLAGRRGPHLVSVRIDSDPASDVCRHRERKDRNDGDDDEAHDAAMPLKAAL